MITKTLRTSVPEFLLTGFPTPTPLSKLESSRCMNRGLLILEALQPNKDVTFATVYAIYSLPTVETLLHFSTGFSLIDQKQGRLHLGPSQVQDSRHLAGFSSVPA